jgi:Flp pilus assembly protein TadB
MSLIQPQQMFFLFTDPRGRGMLAFGVITMTIAILTMRHLIGGVSKD